MHKPLRRSHNWVSSILAVMLLVAPASALVDLELRPVQNVVDLGDVAKIELYAVSDDEDQTTAAADVVLMWPNDSVDFIGNDDTGAVELLSSGFPMPDPFGLNDDMADGTGLYVAFAPLGDPVDPTPEGTLLTTIEFEATAAGIAEFSILPSHESGAETVVFDGEVPNLDVTGDLLSASIEIVQPRCPADLNDDSVVNVADLLMVLGEWGMCEGECDADISGDRVVNVTDLLELLAAWGSCS